MKRLILFMTSLLVGFGGMQTIWGAPPIPRAFSLAVVSDIHLDLDKLRNALGDMTAQNIDALVLVGDSCDGQDHEYAAIKRVLATTPRPPNLFFTMGNHEYYASYHKDGGEYDEMGFPNGETTRKCQARFNRFRGADPDGPVYYDAWVNGYHLIFLGGEKSRMDDASLFDDAVLTTAQLSWLNVKLREKATPGKPTFVFLHQPFPHTVSGSRDATSIRPAGELRNILSHFPQTLFFSGHTHWELNLPTTHYTDKSSTVHMFNTSSLRDPYNTRDVPIQRDMSEGLLVQVLPGQVIVKGRDFLGHAFIKGQVYRVGIPTGR